MQDAAGAALVGSRRLAFTSPLGPRQQQVAARLQRQQLLAQIHAAQLAQAAAHLVSERAPVWQEYGVGVGWWGGLVVDRLEPPLVVFGGSWGRVCLLPLPSGPSFAWTPPSFFV